MPGAPKPRSLCWLATPAPGAVPGTSGASAGHVGAAPPGGAVAFRSSPPKRRGRGARAPARAAGKRRQGDAAAPGAPALRPQHAGSGAERCPPPAASGGDAAGLRAAAARVAGLESATQAPRGGRSWKRSRHPPRRGGRRPCCPARPWPGSTENASRVARPQPSSAPLARSPPELPASPPPPPPPSCGRPAAGCARDPRPLAAQGWWPGSSGSQRRARAPAGVQRGMQLRAPVPA